MMGEEQYGKGSDVLLGPACGPIGRAPTGGRNWEGFSVDPYHSGEAMAQVVRGIQGAGVIATAKHFVANEQGKFACSNPKLVLS
jgi:beta-glucosidase